jgi:Leucine-rich repeat (LRR) protein
MIVCKAARVGVKEGLSTIKSLNCSEQLRETRFCINYTRASSRTSEPRPMWNTVPSLPAELLQRLSGLKSLRLDVNSLTSVPADIGGLSSLTALYFRGNKLTSLPTEFG